MPTINMLIRKSKKKSKELKDMYLNKSICVNRCNMQVFYYVHKVSGEWLYCYHGKEEIRFKPYEVTLN